MAIYYVRPDGNNFNDGLGYLGGSSMILPRAFQTIAKAVSVVAAGDTIIIAPGTYFETITLSTAGTSSAIISWIGDKEAQYFLDMKPGAVRITGCDSVSGITPAANGTIINCNAKSYNYFYNLVIDGTGEGGGTTYGINASTTNYINAYDCIINGTYLGFYGIAPTTNFLYRCLVTGVVYGIYGATTYNCVSIGCTYAYYGCTSYNCIGFGIYPFATGGGIFNCMAIGALGGFYQNSCTIYNSVAYGCYTAFYSTVGTRLIKCKAINCGASATFNASTVNMNISDCKYTNSYINTAGTTIVGTPTKAKYEGWNDVSKILKLAEALKFNVSETEWSTDLNDLVSIVRTYPSSLENTAFNVSGSTYNGQNLYRDIFGEYLIYYESGTTKSQYPIYKPYDLTSANATTYLNTSFYPYNAINQSLSLTSFWNLKSWLAAVFTVTNQRFHIDLGSSKNINKIYYENNHNSGGNTDTGAKNFTFWGSNTQSAYDTLTYSADTFWTQITGLTQTFFNQHKASDNTNPKYISLTGNTASYRYYAFKIADNWGSTDYMGVRRIELQTDSNWYFQANTTMVPNTGATAYAYNNNLTGEYNPIGGFQGYPNIYTKLEFPGDCDISRNSRRLGSGATLDCGVFEYSQVDMEWSTYKTAAPAVKITQAGYYTLTATVKAGIPKTVGCWAYFSGSTLPQIIAHSSEDILAITSGYTATAVGSELTWKQLSLTFTPKASGFLQLSLYARDTVTGSFTIFSDFSL